MLASSFKLYILPKGNFSSKLLKQGQGEFGGSKTIATKHSWRQNITLSFILTVVLGTANTQS